MTDGQINKPDAKEPLESVWQGSFMLGNCEMRCHMLSDGTRIIEEESLANFFMGEVANTDKFYEQLLEFAKWMRGK